MALLYTMLRTVFKTTWRIKYEVSAGGLALRRRSPVRCVAHRPRHAARLDLAQGTSKRASQTNRRPSAKFAKRRDAGRRSGRGSTDVLVYVGKTKSPQERHVFPDAGTFRAITANHDTKLTRRAGRRHGRARALKYVSGEAARDIAWSFSRPIPTQLGDRATSSPRQRALERRRLLRGSDGAADQGSSRMPAASCNWRLDGRWISP